MSGLVCDGCGQEKYFDATLVDQVHTIPTTRVVATVGDQEYIVTSSKPKNCGFWRHYDQKCTKKATSTKYRQGGIKY